MISPVMEDYLKAIYEIRDDHGEPVATSDIAEYLDVTAPTVSKMLDKLTDCELVDREKYRGVGLTEEGETVALEVLRHHRLLESYLAEHLDYEWTEVHDEAEVLEHHISEEFEQRVADALEDPTVDPHGDPIPDADLQPIEDRSTPLATHEAGDRLVVSRIRDREEETLAHLARHGITPGTEIAIREVDPVGLYVVAHPDGEVRLPEEVVADICVVAAEDLEVEVAP
ncbi:MAG: metal-dependent transcriptional regulator [Halobacteriales archaeon]